MDQKHIDVTRCVDCGCDRGGVIDLSVENPVLRSKPDDPDDDAAVDLE